MRYLRSALIVFLLVSWASGCRAPKGELREITLPMGYVANVQFSPFYMGKEKGYFAEAGIDLTFDYRWETDGIQLTAAGEIPFTVASGDQVIQARSQGLPVVAVASWYQKFPVAIVALESTPLSSPEDLRGLRIGIPETFGASYIGLRALKAGGLTEEDIELVTIGYTQAAALTAESVDAVVVYANNEPMVLRERGVAINTLYVSDYASLVSAAIVTSDATMQNEPELVQAFVDAFLKGLAEVIADPDDAFELSRSYIEGLDANAREQRAVLEASVELWQTATPGRFDAEAWAYAQSVMLEAGLIEQGVPIEQLYTNAFVE